MYKKISVFEDTSHRLTSHLAFLPEDELSIVQLRSVSAGVCSHGQIEASFLFDSCAMLQKQWSSQVSAVSWDTSQSLMKWVTSGEKSMVARFITMSLFTSTFETGKLQHGAFSCVKLEVQR